MIKVLFEVGHDELKLWQILLRPALSTQSSTKSHQSSQPLLSSWNSIILYWSPWTDWIKYWLTALFQHCCTNILLFHSIFINKATTQKTWPLLKKKQIIKTFSHFSLYNDTTRYTCIPLLYFKMFLDSRYRLFYYINLQSGRRHKQDEIEILRECTVLKS